MKILASIYAESTDQDKRDKAKDFLKKVTQHDAHDIDSWIQLAEILEGVDLQGIKKNKRFFLIFTDIFRFIGCLYDSIKINS
jgi:hypothetical protein